MAKYKKMMPPRRTSIRGQDHLLAYITPEEAQMLMDQGGSGKPGPMGIPSFFTDGGYDDDDFDGSFDAVAEANFSNEDVSQGGNEDAADVLSRAVQKDFGVSSPTAAQIEQARGFNFGSDASDALIAQMQGGYGGSILGDKYAGSGFENRMFFDQLPARLANAQAGYGLPGYLGLGLGALGTRQLNTMRDQVLSGGIPALDAAGKFQGVFSKGPFGFDVYTGMPIEGNELTGWNAGGSPGEDIKPVDPVTGQCEEGYIFDEDLQACRLDTGASAGAVGSVVPPAPGGYARMGLLDVAPTGLPQFQQTYGAGFGTPADFGAANLAFRQRGATYPEFYQNPPQLSGYTLLS